MDLNRVVVVVVASCTFVNCSFMPNVRYFHKIIIQVSQRTKRIIVIAILFSFDLGLLFCHRSIVYLIELEKFRFSSHTICGIQSRLLSRCRGVVKMYVFIDKRRSTLRQAQILPGNLFLDFISRMEELSTKSIIVDKTHNLKFLAI